jgi:fructosamine-3-kinase
MSEQTIREAVAAALGTPVRDLAPLGGSFAGRLYRVRTQEGEFALKWAEQPAPGALQAEARGLRLLAEAGAVRVPAVRHVIDRSGDGGDGPAWLLIAWIAGGRGVDMAALGASLATLHRHSAPAYGLDHDNYIGGTPQLNRPHADWPGFFREQRLVPQIVLAAHNGLLPAPRRRGLERLLERLDALLAGASTRPSLIHGDLWSGNVIATTGGAPVVIDPAVSFSDREAELAFTELFGGFGPRFYAAYHEVWPLDPGYPERRDLYNLYHLLNHLNLFGEGYGAQIDAVLRRYVGV